MDTHYIVQTAAAHMPNSCWGRYGKVAVLEVDSGLERVSMISERAIGCHRVVSLWDRKHIGTTERAAFQTCVRLANAEATVLNGEAK